MKKFSKENKILENNEINKTKEELLKDKFSKLIEDTLTIEINKEPNINENYSLKGKKELLEKLLEIYNLNEKLSKDKFSKIYNDRYKKTINKEEIELMIETLKNNYKK